MPTYCRTLLALAGIEASVHEGEFNQYYQDILDPESSLIRFDPDIVFLSASLREMAPEILSCYGTLTSVDRKKHRERIIAHLRDWAQNALTRTHATLLIANFPVPALAFHGLADLNDHYGQTEFFLELNLSLVKEFKQEPRVHVFDLDGLAGRFGKDRVHDARMYYLAKKQWADAFTRVIAAQLVRYTQCISRTSKKCLALDLDNTLWGGDYR